MECVRSIYVRLSMKTIFRELRSHYDIATEQQRPVCWNAGERKKVKV